MGGEAALPVYSDVTAVEDPPPLRRDGRLRQRDRGWPPSRRPRDWGGRSAVEFAIVEPMNALFAGLNVTKREMKSFVKKTLGAHTKYGDLVRLLFLEVLVVHGLLDVG